MARDLWLELQRLFAPSGTTGQYDAFIEDVNFHIHENKDIPGQINTLVNTFHKMSITGLTLPENQKAMILLNSLPHSYKSVISTIIQTTTNVNFTMEHMIPLIITKSQLCHSTSHRRALVNHLDQQPSAHKVNRTSTIQHAPHSTTMYVCVNIAEKVILWTTVGQNMAVLVNAPTILIEDIAVLQDHPNLMVLLDNTIPRITKNNILPEVEEVFMGVNLSKEKHVLMK